MTVFRRFSPLFAFFQHENIMRIILISCLILSINWLSAIHFFSQNTFAFKPTNQLGQQQKEITLSSSSNDYSPGNYSNMNMTAHSLALESLQKGITNKTVEIVFDSTLLGDKAYDPNPSIVDPNTTISWHNKDHILHTVTSGQGMEDNNKGKEFDSPIIFSDKTYSHTFFKVGTFPYFCILHPTMIGKVIVIANENASSLKNITDNKE
jgi:plastocyanin